MKKSKHSDTQIVSILKEAEAGQQRLFVSGRIGSGVAKGPEGRLFR